MAFCESKDRGGLRGSRGLEPLRRLWHHRPLDRFREAVKHLARRAFHRHALGSEAVQENAAIRAIKGKEVWPAEQIRTVRVFLFKRLRILSGETRCMFFAIQV